MSRRRLECPALVVGILTALTCVQLQWMPNQDFQRLTEAETPMLMDAPCITEPIDASRPPILFVHFHKSGGTTVCETMRRFQMQVNITNALGLRDDQMTELNNCNTEFTNPHVEYNHFHSVQNCRMLEPYTMNDSGESYRRNNFVAVEVPLKDSLPCPRFRSFALMREPMERVLSHLYYENIPEISVVQWVKKKKLGGRYDFFVNGYPAINNLVTRQLLGIDRYMNTAPINDTDFEKAKLQVDKFDAFVPLEYLRDEKVLTLLNRTVPEFYEGILKNKRVANHQPGKVEKYRERIIHILKRENEYDTQLYNYVKDKLGVDAASRFDVKAIPYETSVVRISKG